MSEILVRTDGGQWLEPVERGFGYEADLQRLLVEHPQLIPGVGTGAVASREFQSGAGPADIVVVDPDGTLTLVECKLATNKDIRRVIVGQMFDYASGFFNCTLTSSSVVGSLAGRERWKVRLGIRKSATRSVGICVRGASALCLPSTQ